MAGVEMERELAVADNKNDVAKEGSRQLVRRRMTGTAAFRQARAQKGFGEEAKEW